MTTANNEKQWICIATDQHGVPRAWGIAATAIEAMDECADQIRAYQTDRPDVRLTRQPAHLIEA